MIVTVWLVLVFVIGLMVGSFLNVVVARLPLEKSLVWPGSRCGNCLQPIRWYDNLPVVSYLVLRGRCRQCGASYSPRYLFVELVTGLGFAGLFYLEVVSNIHSWPDFNRGWLTQQGMYPWQWWVGFAWHALLFTFLLAAAVCDLGGREIPLQLTLTGTAIGLVGAVFLPWPWPDSWAAIQARLAPAPELLAAGHRNPLAEPWWQLPFPVPTGLYPWPFWGPPPDWAPPGSWQMGLLTGVAGALGGTFLMRLIAFLFSTGLGKEALGLGDADLMMMAGAFLGWQPVVVALFVSVLPALVLGVLLLVIHKDNAQPFGPSLGAGVLLTMLVWEKAIGPGIQVLLFWGTLMLVLLAIGAGFMLASSYLIRLVRR
ncbi:MAG: prepilin peptidase [Gemmataceae bacterium]|nr:prepilin peptidase [Gemmataceae bacterium]